MTTADLRVIPKPFARWRRPLGIRWFVVFGAAGDRAVSVNDQRTGTGATASTICRQCDKSRAHNGRYGGGPAARGRALTNGVGDGAIAPAGHRKPGARRRTPRGRSNRLNLCAVALLLTRP